MADIMLRQGRYVAVVCAGTLIGVCAVDAVAVIARETLAVVVAFRDVHAVGQVLHTRSTTHGVTNMMFGL